MLQLSVFLQLQLSWRCGRKWCCSFKCYEFAVIRLFALVNDTAVAIVKSAAGTLIDVAVVNNAAVANVARAAANSFVVLVNNAAVAVFNAAAVL